MAKKLERETEIGWESVANLPRTRHIGVRDWPWPVSLVPRAGLARSHGEHRVQKEDALAAPRGEAAVLGGCNAQVVVELEVNIPEGAGKRAHVREHGEGQSVRIPRGWVRVLPQDYDAHIIEVAGSKGGELVLSRR